MTNAIITTKNWVDDASTITSTNAVASLPVTNLQDMQIVKVWRTSATSAVVDVDFGSQQAVEVISLIRHNLTQSGTLRFRLSNVSDFSTTVYDSGTFNGWPVAEQFGAFPWGVFSWGGVLDADVAADYTVSSYKILSSITLARYFRMDVSDATNPAGYVQAGRLIVSPAYRPSNNYAFGMEIEFVDNSRVQKSRGGQTYIDLVEKYRVATIDLFNLPESEVFGSLFNELDRRRGIGRDILLIPQPSDEFSFISQNLYGRIQSSTPIVNNVLELYGKQITVEELI